MAGLTDILEKVKGHHPRAKIDLIEKAFDYAEHLYEGTSDESGHFHLVHRVAVADILADMRLDASSVCAGLLHDVVKDGVATVPDIEEVFGEEVAFLVDAVTRLDQLIFTSHGDREAARFRKMLVAIARDVRVVLVKLAARLDEMRTLHSRSRDAQKRIASETLDIYAPLAHRLGIQWLKVEFEDLSFRYLEPEAFAALQAQVSAVASSTDRYIADVISQVENMLLSRGLSARISGRRKHLYSIHKKMRRRGIEFEQVKDFVAFRVTTDCVADCYAALGVIHSEWAPVQGRFKDYIALPKPNKYQSLHTTVIGPEHRRVEIQIRTVNMHRTAEYGIAAHWLYKEHAGDVDPKDVARFAWLRQVTEFQREVGDVEDSDQVAPVNPFSEDVYVFTPEGDVKTFPRGATPVDFAYAVDSEIGDRCAGARVNGSIVSLRHKLQNGDVVDIITHKSHRPNERWLEFVATDLARSRIRAYRCSEDQPDAIRRGHDLLVKALRHRHVSPSRFWKGAGAKQVLDQLGAQTQEELYARIGTGEIALDSVFHAIDSESHGKHRGGVHDDSADHVTHPDEETSELRVEGMDEMVVHLAGCCRPVHGDPVTGWITHGRGVSVHRRGCPRVLALEPERRVEVSWADEPDTAVGEGNPPISEE